MLGLLLRSNGGRRFLRVLFGKELFEIDVRISFLEIGNAGWSLKILLFNLNGGGFLSFLKEDVELAAWVHC